MLLKSLCVDLAEHVLIDFEPDDLVALLGELAESAWVVRRPKESAVKGVLFFVHIDTRRS